MIRSRRFFLTLLLLAGNLLLLGCLSALDISPPIVIVSTSTPPSVVQNYVAHSSPPATRTLSVTKQAPLLPATVTPLPSKTAIPVTYEADLPVIDPSMEGLRADEFLFLETVTSVPFSNETVIGYSAQARPIISYRLGQGPTELVFVGGIHGGYEWNTILLAYRMLDNLADNPELIPDSLTIHIIPAANPDGQFLVTGKEGRFSPSDVRADTFPGRFNGNGVDLNRNWDCNWSPIAHWRQEQINSGAYAFSEPENQALRDFFLALNPAAVVFWHSAANAVFVAGCPDLYLSSRQLATIYGRAASYPVRDAFTSYTITGDATDWLATQDIPAITVELINHHDLDWSQNRAGVLALLAFFACCTLD